MGLVLSSLESEDQNSTIDEKRREAQNNISELTGNVLKVCNVIREKNYGSKVLYKQTGTICGARSGTR